MKTASTQSESQPGLNSSYPSSGDVFDRPVGEWPHALQMEYNTHLAQIIAQYPNNAEEAHKMVLFSMRLKHPELSKQRECKRFADALDKAKKQLLGVPKSEVVSEIGKHARKLFRMVIGWQIEEPQKVLDEFLPFAEQFEVTKDDIEKAVYSAYRIAKNNPAKLLSKGNPVKVYDETGRGLYGAKRNAETFLQAHGDSLRYVASQKQWFSYNDGLWEQDDILEHEYLAWSTCLQLATEELEPSKRHSLVQYSVAQSMLRASQSDKRIVAVMQQWDNDSWLLSSGSNVVDLRTGEQRSARHDDYITKQASLLPEFCVVPIRWQKFLAQITGNNQGLIDYLQMLCGYCLTGSTREQHFFFFYGTGKNGKSVFMNVLYSLLQDYVRFIPDTVLMATKYEGHKETLARLQGARIVMANEVKQGSRWNEARIKDITGGTPITANYMHQNSFEFVPQFKLLIAGNHKPALNELGEAMVRRLRLIPFTFVVPEDQRINNLDQVLVEEEGGAILAWMVEGCQKWQSLKGGLDAALPTVVKDATKDYFDAEDKVIQFLKDNFDVDMNSHATFERIYFLYCQWANEEGIKPTYQFTKKTLMERIREKGFADMRTMYGMAIVGLKKKEDGNGTPVQPTEITSGVPFTPFSGVFR